MAQPHPLFVLNGSNLNKLGLREPQLYGTTPLAQIQARTDKLAAELGLACDFRQTNHEGVLVDWIQEAFDKEAAVIINPAGFSFGCVPVLDALKLIAKPVVEVHITNIHQRESFRQNSYVSKAAKAVICGFGIDGYALAITGLAGLIGVRA